MKLLFLYIFQDLKHVQSKNPQQENKLYNGQDFYLRTFFFKVLENKGF
jgi:hypothetical protein